ncbi:MAG: ABC transporter permease [Dehalococcoidales bacterium]|nr:ABC transporter permease [Dehalococcoidales bacterium]
MFVVLQRDFRELRQSGAFRIMLAISGVISLGAAIGISIALGRQSWLGEKEAAPFVEMIMGLVAYFVPFLVLMAFIWASGSLSVTREKVNGNIESLLATPLSPKAIWMGKCLAVFLPGLVISIIATLIVVLAVNFAAIVPATGEIVLPVSVLLTGFVVNPLLLSGVLAFIVLFSLANNPDIAIAPSFLVGFGLMIAIPAGVGLGAIDITSWAFTLWYLLGAVLVWIIVLYLSRLLTRENVVLSSKGE